MKAGVMYAVSLSCFLFSLVGRVTEARADFKAAQWEHCRGIDTRETGAAGNCRIALDKTVYDGAQVPLADLRLIGEANSEIPYVISVMRGRSETKSMPSAIIGNAQGKDNSNILILDMGARPMTHNKVTLAITERNFGVKARVEASDDLQTWELLANNAYIYDFSFGGGPERRYGEIKWSTTVNSKYMVDFSYVDSARDTAVSYPESGCRYVRITLQGSKDEKALTITSAEAVSHIVFPGEEEEYACAVKENTVDPQARTTAAILDFGARNLPLERVLLSCDGADYYRTVLVKGSNDGTAWFDIGGGTVFDYNIDNFKDAKREIMFPESRCRFVKLIILNQDNPPIKVVSAKGFGVRRYLVFPSVKTGGVNLYYGNREAREPRYDYSRYAGKADFSAMAVVRWGEHIRNPLYAPQKQRRPWSEEHSALLWVAVVGIVLILLLLVGSMLKTVKSGS